ETADHLAGAYRRLRAVRRVCAPGMARYARDPQWMARWGTTALREGSGPGLTGPVEGAAPRQDRGGAVLGRGGAVSGRDGAAPVAEVVPCRDGGPVLPVPTPLPGRVGTAKGDGVDPFTLEVFCHGDAEHHQGRYRWVRGALGGAPGHAGGGAAARRRGNGARAHHGWSGRRVR